MIVFGPMPWLLIVDEGDPPRRLVLDSGPQVAGSEARADLVLDHPTVSRRHAELEPTNDGVWVRDLGSSNGTRIDGRPVRQRVLVATDQVVHFGTLQARFERADARELEPALQFHEDIDSGPPPDQVRARAATLSIGSVRDFVLGALPRLVAGLEARRGTPTPTDGGLAFVQAAGLAIFEAFPCRGLEIVESSRDAAEEAVLFRAGEALVSDTAQNDLGEREGLVRVAVGSLVTRLELASGLHAQGVVPLVELVTRLAALEHVPASPGASALPVPDEPSLPQPATLDPRVRQIYDDARRVARGEIGVLIAGESGTGKEVLAKFVHASSHRAGASLVALNCAALPQDLLEAELFGIEKGVATGVDARPGRFEQAHGGTLFLDEIGDMAAATQAKILRVLQEGEVFRLGARTARPADVRVIAATNRDLARMIEDGSFRRDLFHRIADCRFELPPLRQRLSDLPNLAAHFLVRAASKNGVAVRGISRAALDALTAFPWPGNLRQLEREMARAALFLEPGDLLQTRHLSDEARAGGRAGVGGSRTLKERLEVSEREIIVETLGHHQGNVRAAAAELGLGRSTLYRRLTELGIDP